MKTILVTGSNGFVGQHLVRELSDNGYKVIGVGGKRTSSMAAGAADTLELDLTNKADAAKIDFRSVDGVIHLAGLAAVGPSFSDPLHYITTNIGIEVNLFEAALAQNAKPRFLIVSTGALYDPSSPMPLSETSAVMPYSPYAVSKLGQEAMSDYYRSRGFECIVTRPFNHIGPGQGPGFIVPDIAQQLVAVEEGRAQEILVGNLDAERDYTDVRDIARAYRLLMERGKAGEIYNICSGKAVSGHELMTQLLNLSKVTPEIKVDPAKQRPSDNALLFGNNEKLKRDTGWSPEIPLAQTLADVMQDWRAQGSANS